MVLTRNRRRQQEKTGSNEVSKYENYGLAGTISVFEEAETKTAKGDRWQFVSEVGFNDIASF